MKDPIGLAIIEAWTTPGAAPDFHRKVKNRIRKDWPALSRALDNLVELGAASTDDPTGPRLFIVREKGGNHICQGYVWARDLSDAQEVWNKDHPSMLPVTFGLITNVSGAPTRVLSPNERVVSRDFLELVVKRLQEDMPNSPSRNNLVFRLQRLIQPRRKFVLGIEGSEKDVNDIVGRLRSHLFPIITVEEVDDDA